MALSGFKYCIEMLMLLEYHSFYILESDTEIMFLVKYNTQITNFHASRIKY